MVSKASIRGVTLSREDKATFVNVLFLLLVGSVVVTWFRGDYVLTCWDATFPWNPMRNLYAYSYTWHEEWGTGIPNVSIAFLPFFVIVATLHNVLGLSLSISQKVVFYILFVSSGLGMYFLAKRLSATKKHARAICLGSALFYMFNLYPAIYLWRALLSNVFSYSFLPFLLLTFIRATHAHAKQDNFELVKNAVAFGFFSLLVNISQPATDVWMVLGLFSIYYLLTQFKLKKIFHGLKLILSFSVLWFGLIMWVVLPIFSLSGSELARFQDISNFLANSQHSSVLNVLRLVGQPEISYYSKEAYGLWETPLLAPWLLTYRSPLFFLMSCAIPLLVWIPLLHRSRDGYTVLFSSIGLFGLVVVAGAQPPFGRVYSELFLMFRPYSFIFNGPYLYFGGLLSLSYAFLIGHGIGILMELPHEVGNGRIGRFVGALDRKFGLMKAVAVALMVMITVLYMWPMWTGDVVPERARVRLPSYYLEAAQWLTQQEEDFAVFSLPQQTDCIQSLDWGYVAPVLFRMITMRPTIAGWTAIDVQQDQMFASIYDEFHRGNPRLLRTLGALNVKYVLVQNDIDESYKVPVSVNRTKAILGSQHGVSFVRSFGELDFYQIDSYASRIYISTDPVLASASVESPLGVGFETYSFEQGWDLNAGELTLGEDGKGVKMSFGSPGSYAFVYMTNSESLHVDVSSYPYLLLRLRTNPSSAACVSVEFEDGESSYLSAVNPPSDDFGDNYQSLEWYTLVYDLRSFDGLVQDVNIFLTNRPNSTCEGTLELWVDYVKFASTIRIESFADTLQVMSDDNFTPGSSVLIAPRDLSEEQVALIESLIGSSKSSSAAQLLDWKKVDPTQYIVRVNADSPYILVLSQSYNQGWKAIVDGEEVTTKFEVNLYLNGWYIDKRGSYDVIIEFTPQRSVELGRTDTIITWVSLFSISVYTIISKRNRHLRVQNARDKGL